MERLVPTDGTGADLQGPGGLIPFQSNLRLVFAILLTSVICFADFLPVIPILWNVFSMNFARWTFWIAGWYGLAVILPQYFLEHRIGMDYPPAITHPEHFYGFIGVALAWQVAFLIMSRDPVRHRPLMLAAVLEKASFGIAALVLYAQNRLAVAMVPFAILDLALGVLFLEAFRQTGNASALRSESGGTV